MKRDSPDMPLKPITSSGNCMRNCLFFPRYAPSWGHVFCFFFLAPSPSLFPELGDLLCVLNESVEGSSGATQWSSVWDLLRRHSYAQYSQSFSLTRRTKACCQATRLQEIPADLSLPMYVRRNQSNSSGRSIVLHCGFSALDNLVLQEHAGQLKSGHSAGLQW